MSLMGEIAQHGVRTANTEARTLGKLAFQDIDVLGAVAAVDEVTHHRKQGLAVLVAYCRTAQAEIRVHVGH